MKVAPLLFKNVHAIELFLSFWGRSAWTTLGSQQKLPSTGHDRGSYLRKLQCEPTLEKITAERSSESRPCMVVRSDTSMLDQTTYNKKGKTIINSTRLLDTCRTVVSRKLQLSV